MTTEPATTPAPTQQPWHRVAATYQDDRTVLGLRTWWASYAQAHLEAYKPWGGGETAEERRAHVRDQTDRYAYPGFAGFTVAALLAGWTPGDVLDAIEDGASVAEWLWRWLSEVGIDSATIAPAGTDATR